jgi:hypothetical protein
MHKTQMSYMKITELTIHSLRCSHHMLSKAAAVVVVGCMRHEVN